MNSGVTDNSKYNDKGNLGLMSSDEGQLLLMVYNCKL